MSHWIIESYKFTKSSSYFSFLVLAVLNVYFVKEIKVLNKDGQNEIIKTKDLVIRPGRGKVAEIKGISGVEMLSSSCK